MVDPFLAMNLTFLFCLSSSSRSIAWSFLDNMLASLFFFFLQCRSRNGLNHSFVWDALVALIFSPNPLLLTPHELRAPAPAHNHQWALHSDDWPRARTFSDRLARDLARSRDSHSMTSEQQLRESVWCIFFVLCISNVTNTKLCKK